MDSSSVAIVATNAVFITVAAGSLGVRFRIRMTKSKKLETEDWLAVASFGFSAALALTNILGVPLGSFGTQFDKLSEEQAVSYLKFFFVIQFWYVAAVTAIKLTVLYLYKRLFGPSSSRYIIYILIATTIGWGLAFFVATMFQILPIWCNWVACQPTSNYPLMYLMSSITDLILDIIILCLPIIFIRPLNMELNKKIGVAGIFGLGLFCIVASTARLYYTWTYMQANITGDYASNFDLSADNFIMWSGIEACISTTCANLPTYGPLITAMHKRIHSSAFSTAHPSLELNHDSTSKDQLHRWPTSPARRARAASSSWKPNPSLPSNNSIQRLPSKDDTPSSQHSWKSFFSRTIGRAGPEAEITPLKGIRYSGTTCPCSVQVEHDCQGVVHQVIEMSVVRTSKSHDGEFRLFPSTPGEAMKRMT